ncbi:hypothetical protein [Saccharopolyspora sp. NPDC002686]|uniref:hypothetical protein n=1 Tax=Saccharopolyspora sp. NPDC002686 TaxID=3154541 RepID=UPI003329EF5C
MSPEWLVRGGSVVPKAIVLSHHEQLDRLAATTPQALPAAVVAGDPCFDRLRASLPERFRYRRALGADESSTVVAVSSTWGDNSLLGQHPDLIAELLAELPDDHIVAAIMHPNTWYAHGPWQLRYWLGKALRSGLRLIPPAEGWQQAIIAADVTIGDHGAVTGYSAALGKPTLLATFPESEVAAGSAVAAFGAAASRLDMRVGLAVQLHEAVQQHSADQFREVEQLTSSVPDESAQHLRRSCYRIMRLPEPPGSAPVPVYPARALAPERDIVRAWWISGEWRGADVQLTRWPADVNLRRGRKPVSPDRFLVVRSTHPQRDVRNSAAVVIHEVDLTDEVDDALARTLAAFPACQLAVATTGEQCWMQNRDGRRLAATALDVVAAAAAVHLWSEEDRDWSAIPPRFALGVSARRLDVVIATGDQ